MNMIIKIYCSEYSNKLNNLVILHVKNDYETIIYDIYSNKESYVVHTTG
jgi:hypothetical protein